MSSGDWTTKLQHVLRLHEVWTASFYVDCFMDGLGTLWLVFMGSLLSMTFNPDDGTSHGTLTAALGTGMTVVAILETIGHLQWAAINPVVATAFMITGKISPIKALFYILFEIIFGIVGAFIAWGVSPSSVRETFTVPGLAEDVTSVQGLVVTAMVTATLVLVTLGSLDDVIRKPTIPSLATGLTVAAGILATGPHSSAMMNPAVALSVSIVSSQWKHHWVCWVGGFLGGVSASLLYPLLSRHGGQGMKDYIARRRDDTPTATPTNTPTVTPTDPPKEAQNQAYTNDGFNMQDVANGGFNRTAFSVTNLLEYGNTVTDTAP